MYSKNSVIHGNPNIDPDQSDSGATKDQILKILRHEAGHVYFLWLGLKDKFGPSKAKIYFREINPEIQIGWKERMRGEPRSIGTDGNWEFIRDHGLDEDGKIQGLYVTIGGPCSDYYYYPEKWRDFPGKLSRQLSDPSKETKDFVMLNRKFGLSEEDIRREIKAGIDKIKAGKKFIESIVSAALPHPETWGKIKIWNIVNDKI